MINREIERDGLPRWSDPDLSDQSELTPVLSRLAPESQDVYKSEFQSNVN